MIASTKLKTGNLLIGGAVIVIVGWMFDEDADVVIIFEAVGDAEVDV